MKTRSYLERSPPHETPHSKRGSGACVSLGLSYKGLAHSLALPSYLGHPPQKVPLQSNLETEQCRLGKHTRHERGKPSVAQTLRALPIHASDICLQCSSLPTAHLNKLAYISDHLCPFVSGQKLDIEET